MAYCSADFQSISISGNRFISRRFFVPTQQPVSASFTTTLGVRLKVSVTPRGLSESGRGQPHSKTLRADSDISNIRQVLECGCPLPLLYRCGCPTVFNRTPTLVAACPRCAVSQHWILRAWKIPAPIVVATPSRLQIGDIHHVLRGRDCKSALRHRTCGRVYSG